MRFAQMVTAPPMRNEQVIRYSGIKMVEPESLSIHLVDVQMLGYAMIRTMNKDFGESIDIGLFLEKALIHDLDEVLTGDMPRSTKYYNKTILNEMKEVANDAMSQVSDSFFNDRAVYDVWATSKHGKEGIIVKVVDMMCVASKTMKEVEMLNNNYFLKVAYEVRDHLTHVIQFLSENSPYTMSATKYLVSLLTEAQLEIDRIWEERKDIAERYGILTNIFKGKGAVVK